MYTSMYAYTLQSDVRPKLTFYLVLSKAGRTQHDINTQDIVSQRYMIGTKIDSSFLEGGGEWNVKNMYLKY